MEIQLQTQINNIIAKMPVDAQEEALRYLEELWKKTEKQSVEKLKEAARKRIGYFPKGSFVMSDDFDEPLDCFKEYMQ